MFVPRPYQTGAINAGVQFLNAPKKGNAFMILPTGSGKSVVIAHITKQLTGKTLILQPSKEILEQNYAKFTSQGYRAEIYSASLGQNFVGHVTFATIGSIIRKKHLFYGVENILIDECHLVNPEEGMYQELITSLPKAKLLGLTATPYRLTADFEGAMLKFLNRCEPKIFDRCIYYVQNKELFDAGHLAKLDYYTFDLVDRTMLQTNAKGTDFTEASLRSYYRQIDMAGQTVRYTKQLLARRKNLMVFTSLVEEAERVARSIPGVAVVTGETEDAKRTQILKQFTAGKIRCVANVGVLTTGFDYPELETVLISRSTMSLALYYQIIGRVMRPHKDKASAWVVDLGGNVKMFGKIETMEIKENSAGLLSIWNNGRQLTNVNFTKN